MSSGVFSKFYFQPKETSHVPEPVGVLVLNLETGACVYRFQPPQPHWSEYQIEQTGAAKAWLGHLVRTQNMLQCIQLLEFRGCLCHEVKMEHPEDIRITKPERLHLEDLFNEFVAPLSPRHTHRVGDPDRASGWGSDC